MRWLLRLFRKRKLETQLDAELRFHIEQRTADLVAGGVEPAEARRRAMVEFGGVERAKEECREARGSYFLESIFRDLRYALRTLRKSPGFTTVAILTLALGIGLSTAIFSVMYSVLLQPLPYRSPGRVVVMWKTSAKSVSRVGELSYPEYEDWRHQSKSFETMAAMPTTVYGYAFTLGTPGGPREIESARVTSSFFSVLGIRPELGRTFSAPDDAPGATPTVVLSDALWRGQFQADPGIIGRVIDLSGVGYTVIGVMPRRCTFPAGAEVWAPLGLMPQKLLQNRGAVFLQVVGRLRPGVSVQQAKAELTGIIQRDAADHPETAEMGPLAMVTQLPKIVIGSTRPVVYLLWAASLLLLAIGCLNAMSLLFARTLVRAGEVAVRAALGATRRDLFRQHSAEGLALAVPVVLFGIVFARAALVVVVRIAPQGIYGISSAGLNVPALAFACAISLLMAIVFGAAPALAFGQPEPGRILRGNGRRAGGLAEGARFRNVVLAAEVFVTTILLIGAALVVHSYYNLQGVKLGFDTGNVLTAEIRLSGEKWREPGAQHSFFRELLESLRTRPEVAFAGAVLLRPLEGMIGWDAHYELGGQDIEAARKNPLANLEVATPDYFRAIGTPLIAGRYFLPTDTGSSERVVIVNERLCSAQFGSPSSCIGKRVRLGLSEDGSWSKIVGVVGNAHYRDLEHRKTEIFLPYLQTSIPLRYIVVRTKSDPSPFTPVLRKTVTRIDSDIAIGHVHTMGDLVRSAESRERLSTLLFLLFGISAVVLAAVGVYGNVSEFALHRRREMAIRMALGGQRGDILRKIIGEGMMPVGAGIVAGICSALVLTRFLRNLLFEIQPVDLVTFVGVVIVLVVVALAGCWVPARRATRVNPAEALRQE